MTTWTPAAEQTESWTSEARSPGTFSQLVFSHDYVLSQRVFSFGSNVSTWDKRSVDAEVWTPA